MTHADFNDLETIDYIFKIGDRGKAIQARYDENTDALIFPRAAFDYVYKLLKDALSQEQKSGKWITEEIGEGRKVYCSECKESAVFEYVRDGDIYSSYGYGVVKKTKYCPNCGAKMENTE